MSRKKRDRGEQRAARRLQAAAGMPYQTALQRVRERRAMRGLPLTLARIVRRRIATSQLEVSDANAVATRIATHVAARHSKWEAVRHSPREGMRLPIDSECIFAGDVTGIVCRGLEDADRQTRRLRMPSREFWAHVAEFRADVADVATDILQDITPHVLPDVAAGLIDFRGEVDNCLFPEYDIDDSEYIDAEFHG